MFGARPAGAAGFGVVSPRCRYRGEGILPASPQEVWECIKPVAGGRRTEWDQNVKDFEVIEAISDVSPPKTVLLRLVQRFCRSTGLCTELPVVVPLETGCVVCRGVRRSQGVVQPPSLDQSDNTGFGNIFLLLFFSINCVCSLNGLSF